MRKIGLTLGKFAPLHKGHQFLFETALQEVDEFIVIIYETKVIEIPLIDRVKWINKLYPNIKVILAINGPEGYSNKREHEIKEEEFIKSLLKGKKITHFYSSEYYGKHLSIFLNAIDRRVDEFRLTVPISATKIRENPLKYREFISDIVFQDLINTND